MKRWLLPFIAACAAFVAVDSGAQQASRVRGTIVAIDGATMSVRTREGSDVTLRLAHNLTVAVAKAVRFDDLRAGDYVGTTTRRGPDGADIALEVHYIAPTVTAGQSASELHAGATMTNANVRSRVVGKAAHELTLEVAGREHKVVVPEGAPIVRAVPGTRADLVPGEYVFVSAQAAGDGSLTALRVQVSKDGVRPPQ